MGTVIQDEKLRERQKLFANRRQAGQLLAQKLVAYRDADGIVLAIPSGGVPVAAEIARDLELPMDVVIVRKIQVPFNTEVGFGAVDPEGEVIFNQWFLKQLDLPDEDVLAQTRKTKEIIAQRSRLFRGERPFPDLSGKIAIMVDDGLASGYTMCSAVLFARKKGAAKIIVAVPTGSVYAVDELQPQADELVCLNIRGGFRFAVADAYVEWYDVPDSEVLTILEKFG